MKVLPMSGSLRENVGKKDTKALRRDSKVPCVIYGKDKDQHYNVAIPLNQFDRIIFDPEPCFVEIEINGTKHKAMLKDIEYHPVTEIVYHADFYELSDDKPVVMSVPVHTTGTSVGVMAGGKLVYKARRLLVKALPGNMPSEILLDITKMKIGSRVKIQDIVTNNFEFIQNKSNEVITITSTRAAVDGTDTDAEASEGGASAEGAAPAEQK